MIIATSSNLHAPYTTAKAKIGKRKKNTRVFYNLCHFVILHKMLSSDLTESHVKAMQRDSTLSANRYAPDSNPTTSAAAAAAP